MRKYGKNILYKMLWLCRGVVAAVVPLRERAVLAYHSVGDGVHSTTIPAAAFEKQVEYFLGHGYIFLALSEVVDWLEGKRELPPKCVALTFDDGYADFVTNALPVLEKHTIPATVFVLGDVAAARTHLGNTEELLSDAQLEHLERHELVEIGYHSLSHKNLTELSAEALHEECLPHYFARFFAYPGGNFSAATTACVTSLGYAAAFGIKPVLLQKGQDKFSLPRMVITSDLALWQVAARASKAADWYRGIKRFFGIW